jgi:hypothetical protein
MGSEIGANNSLFGARLKVVSSVFYIAWRDMHASVSFQARRRNDS